jgi:hypothetical protein
MERYLKRFAIKEKKQWRKNREGALSIPAITTSCLAARVRSDQTP